MIALEVRNEPSSIKFLWETISTESHIYNYTDTIVPPACTDKGYIEHKCEECGGIYKDNYVDALGHRDENEDGKCDHAVRILQVCGEDITAGGGCCGYFC